MKNLFFLALLLCLAATPAVAAKQTINAADTGAQSRTKLNANFTELYDGKADKTAVVRYWSDWPTTGQNNVLAVNTIVAYNGSLYKVTQELTKTGSTADPETLTAYFSEVTGASDYTLPTASADTLGGVKVGARLSIVNGVLSADVQSGGESITVGDGTTGPFLDGSSDGGTLIKLAGPSSYWTALQAGNALANRTWRLPIAAPPSAGTTRLMNMDEYGQMGFVDPATFAAALGSDDNYVTDAEKTKLSNLSGTNTGDQSLTSLGIPGVATTGISGTLTFTKTGTTARTVTFPDAAGTVAMTSDIVAAPTDATITTTDVTTNNASTSKHGWLLKATAPSSGLRNVVAIDNGETVYKNAALFDATSPSTQAFGDSAAVGSAMTSARRDHKHAMPAAPTTITGNAGTATALAANGTNCSAGQAALGVDASGNAEGCWTPSGSFDPASPGAIGGTTPAAGTFTTVTASSYASSAADGSRRSILPNNTTISPSGGGVVEIYNEGGAIKAVEAGTEYDVLLSRDLGVVGGATKTVASGTSALGTSAISSGACASAVTTTATGTATTDVINWGFNGDPTGAVGYQPSANGMLTIISYPSANNVNFKVCNNTAASITPGAVTLNWQVTR